jgi:NAD(P)-dependent dehydrogenase (short-subunit alcohol dehydrogenase family)
VTKTHSGSRAIVTGGAQGIGYAIASQLAEDGCKSIAIVGRDKAKGANAVAKLEKIGTEAIFISADISNDKAALGAVEEAAKRFGVINVLANAAATSARASLLETTRENFDFIFHTNVLGPMLLMQGVVKGLLGAKQPGSIVNVLSMSGHGGQPFLHAYSSSKAALAAATRNAAYAYRKSRIRVNAVMPGWMDTEGEDAVQKKWHNAPDNWLEIAEKNAPMGQLVKPEQLAVLVSYMLSPGAGVMTGALVDYDQNIIGVGD